MEENKELEDLITECKKLFDKTHLPLGVNALAIEDVNDKTMSKNTFKIDINPDENMGSIVTVTYNGNIFRGEYSEELETYEVNLDMPINTRNK